MGRKVLRILAALVFWPKDACAISPVRQQSTSGSVGTDGVGMVSSIPNLVRKSKKQQQIEIYPTDVPQLLADDGKDILMRKSKKSDQVEIDATGNAQMLEDDGKDILVRKSKKYHQVEIDAAGDAQMLADDGKEILVRKSKKHIQLEIDAVGGDAQILGDDGKGELPILMRTSKKKVDVDTHAGGNPQSLADEKEAADTNMSKVLAIVSNTNYEPSLFEIHPGLSATASYVGPIVEGSTAILQARDVSDNKLVEQSPESMQSEAVREMTAASRHLEATQDEFEEDDASDDGLLLTDDDHRRLATLSGLLTEFSKKYMVPKQDEDAHMEQSWRSSDDDDHHDHHLTVGDIGAHSNPLDPEHMLLSIESNGSLAPKEDATDTPPITRRRRGSLGCFWWSSVNIGKPNRGSSDMTGTGIEASILEDLGIASQRVIAMYALMEVEERFSMWERWGGNAMNQLKEEYPNFDEYLHMMKSFPEDLKIHLASLGLHIIGQNLTIQNNMGTFTTTGSQPGCFKWATRYGSTGQRLNQKRILEVSTKVFGMFMATTSLKRALFVPVVNDPSNSFNASVYTRQYGNYLAHGRMCQGISHFNHVARGLTDDPTAYFTFMRGYVETDEHAIKVWNDLGIFVELHAVFSENPWAQFHSYRTSGERIETHFDKATIDDAVKEVRLALALGLNAHTIATAFGSFAPNELVDNYNDNLLRNVNFLDIKDACDGDPQCESIAPQASVVFTDLMATAAGTNNIARMPSPTKDKVGAAIFVYNFARCYQAKLEGKKYKKCPNERSWGMFSIQVSKIIVGKVGGKGAYAIKRSVTKIAEKIGLKAKEVGARVLQRQGAVVQAKLGLFKAVAKVTIALKLGAVALATWGFVTTLGAMENAFDQGQIALGVFMAMDVVAQGLQIGVAVGTVVGKAVVAKMVAVGIVTTKAAAAISAAAAVAGPVALFAAATMTVAAMVGMHLAKMNARYTNERCHPNIFGETYCCATRILWAETLVPRLPSNAGNYWKLYASGKYCDGYSIEVAPYGSGTTVDECKAKALGSSRCASPLRFIWSNGDGCFCQRFASDRYCDRRASSKGDDVYEYVRVCSSFTNPHECPQGIGEDCEWENNACVPKGRYPRFYVGSFGPVTDDQDMFHMGFPDCQNNFRTLNGSLGCCASRCPCANGHGAHLAICQSR